MYSNKLYSSLSYFDKYEQNRLNKYINSPYFNKNESLVFLFEILIKHINKERKGSKFEEIDKLELWNKIYPDKKFNDVRFRKLNSELLKLVEGFLAQQTYEANSLYQATHFLEAIGRKKMSNLYSSAIRTARRLSEQQEHKPADYFYYQYQIERNYYELTSKEYRKSARQNIEEIANNLDRFYLGEKLKYYCSVLSHQYFVSHEYKLLFMEEIISHIEKIDYEAIPQISVYYQIYKTQIEVDNVDHYYKLKELLDKHSSIFPENEANIIYEHALNYCIRKINEGKQQFFKEYFDVYVDLLNNELILTEGELDPWHFKNIIAAATRLEKYNWTEKFIHDYKERLPEESRENAISFNLARLYFFQEKYDKVISLLNEVEYDDITYNIGSKALLVKTFFETNEIEVLFSISDSFRVYLQRNKNIPSQRKQIYLNLIKFTKKLAKLTPGDKKGIDKIKKEIEKTDSGIDPWILEKIKEKE